MRPTFRRALAFAAGVAILLAATAGGRAQAAPTLRLPDLQSFLSDFSIVQTATGREFRYTHDLYNGGTGPLEIQPVYNQATGTYEGFQSVYAQDSSGGWSVAQTVPVAGAFVFHAEHGHFHFPMAAFGLYAVAADGGIGAPIAISPKDGFCIADSYILTPSILNAGAFGYSGGTCADPTTLRGISVGGVDEYDHTDPGQSIPIDNVPDGTYWLRAVADPFNYLAESDKSNNETDVQLTISNDVVTVLQTIHRDSTPPAIAFTGPASGSRLSGTVTLSATTSSGGPVQFLLDGQLLGDPVATAPYTLAWDTTTATNGSHWLAARTTGASGNIGTSPVASVSISNGPSSTGIAIDWSASQDGGGVVSATISTSMAGDLLLAFVAADGPNGEPQSAFVSSTSGLAWTLVTRGNGQNGTAEIWAATAPGVLNGEVVTSTLSAAAFGQSLSVLAVANASGIGASASAGSSSGPPEVQLTSTAGGSLSFGVGNDWDAPTPRTPAADQTLVHQWVDTETGDTFWMQSQSVPAASAGALVAIADTAPTADRWNMAALEVLPGAQGPDVTPPVVTMTDPEAGSTVSGPVAVAATAGDNVRVASVQFYVDGAAIGGPLTVPPFTTFWDTTTVAAGLHTVTATATDTSGNLGSASPVTVTVDNSAPPPKVIGIDARVFSDASGTVTTPAFSTPTADDLLVAFVAYDGPADAPQTATVSGAGLNWSLVKRSNTQAGTAEIWTARASGVLSDVTISATPGVGLYSGSLTVIAYTNASGVGVSGIAGAPTGAPDIYLPGVAAGNWVFAVGNDWDQAIDRTPVDGQGLVHEWVDTEVGDTFWVQSTLAPSAVLSVVVIHDSAPVTDRWNYAAVEIVAAR